MSRPKKWRDLLLFMRSAFMCGNKDRSAKSMSADSCFLPIPEVVVYIAVYISSLSCGFYQAYLAGNDFVNEQAELADGWPWLNRKRDDIDYEWEAFKSHTTKYAYWLICHALLTEIVRFVAPKRIPFTHAAIGISFVLINYNRFAIQMTAAMLFSYYFIRNRRPRCIWLLTIFWLLMMNMLKQSSVQEVLLPDLHDLELYEAIVYFCWMVLRLVSFTLDFQDEFDQSAPSEHGAGAHYSIVNYLGYVFYVPTMLHGPPMTYVRYIHMLPLNKYQLVEDFLARLNVLLKTLVRLACWSFLYELAMHYIYANKVVYNSQMAHSVNRWALYGFGIAIGQFFCVKYIISYGLGSAIARFERINAPERPKCVARIQVYSNMWRYFDQGLHEFLLRYIYRGICKAHAPITKKLFASITTFSFIYLWHGYYKFILIWAILNFFCLQAERVGKQFAETTRYQNICKWIGTQWTYRMNAVFGSQLLILSVLSNIMFIGGEEVGIELAKQTYFRNGITNYVTLSICTYCFYQTGEFFFRWEARRMRQKLKT